jgi:hypothetical protein
VEHIWRVSGADLEFEKRGGIEALDMGNRRCVFCLVRVARSEGWRRSKSRRWRDFISLGLNVQSQEFGCDTGVCSAVAKKDIR